MRLVPKEAKMNKGAELQEKTGHHAPAKAASPEKSGTKADMRGAQEGEPTDHGHVGSTSLSHAVGELHKQHPHKYHEHGPHHGTTDHVRHEPLHGLKPR